MDSSGLTALPGIGLAAFVLTDIDDLFVLVAFFAGRAYRTSQIVLGQYLGIAFLVAVGATSYFLRLVLPAEWVGLVGLVPIALGVKEALELRKAPGGGDEDGKEIEEDLRPSGIARAAPAASRALSVAAVAIANGGDNIGVYVPLFASSTPLEIALLAGLFLGMTGVWLFLAWALVSNPLFGGQVRRVGRYVLPAVLVGLGLFVIWRQGTWALVARLFGAPV